MKALEKATKDRQEPTADSPPPETGSNNNGGTPQPNDLTLEPILPQPTQARRPPDPVAVRDVGREGGRTLGGDPARDAARAASVIRAGQRDNGGVGAYVRDHPLAILGGVATLFLLGYGGYVYLQMNNPGMFINQQAALANRPSTSATPVAAAPNPSASVTPPPLATLPLLPSLQPTAPETAVVADPLPAAPVAPLAQRDLIKVKSGGSAPTLNPLLTEAYQALVAGDLETAQLRYSQLQKSDATNPDVWLGLAAIAARQGDNDTAAQHYLKTLELEPRNAAAQAGLIGMLGRADLSAAESRLKQLIDREPSSFLYFTLGNVFADQQRWPEAQQAYFQAHHLQPDNPDYAYNLAVGLEHVGQPKLAIDFYRRAIEVATAKGRANFNPDAAQERIRKLESAGQ